MLRKLLQIVIIVVRFPPKKYLVRFSIKNVIEVKFAADELPLHLLSGPHWQRGALG